LYDVVVVASPRVGRCCTAHPAGGLRLAGQRWHGSGWRMGQVCGGGCFKSVHAMVGGTPNAGARHRTRRKRFSGAVPPGR
jgi:hypothetical protein